MNRPAKQRFFVVIVFALAAGVALSFTAPGRYVLHPILLKLNGKRTVAERVEQYGPDVRRRLAPAFASAGVPFPPRRVMFAAFKKEMRLDLFAAATDGLLWPIKSYTITAASGTAGPKLREGDRQVPEGLYRIESLNPNSLYHLSLRVNYPSDEDRAIAAREGRTNLGGDIMIHGKAVSIGCIAVGDAAAEELFVLAAETGLENIEVLIAPCDLRVCEPARQAEWVMARYGVMRERLAEMGR